MRTRYGRWLLLAAVLTGLYLLGIATNALPWLRGPAEWRWPYVIPGTLARVWLPALVLAGYVLLLHRAGPGDEASPAGRRALWLLIAAALMTPLLQLALLYVAHDDLGRYQLFYRTVSELSGGFYTVGAPVTDIRAFLGAFAEQMPSFPIHPQRHPPGLPVLFALARGFFDRAPALADAVGMGLRPAQCHNLPLMNLPNSAIAAATLQMAVPFLLAAVVWPLYAFGRRVYGGAAGLRAALLWPLVPSVALWASRWNQLYALFTVLVFLLVHLALVRRGRVAYLVAGLVAGLSTFFSFGNVVIVMMVGLYALVWWLAATERPSFGSLVLGGVLFAAGLVLPWALAWLVYRVNFFDLWSTAMGTHLSLGRSYVTWLFYHPYDFFVFLGIALAVFWFGHTWRAFGEWRRRPVDALAVSFAVGLLIVVVSGTSQGEVARVWAFLMPLALVIAVPRPELGSPSAGGSRLAFTGLAALLAAQVFVSNLFLRPVSTGLLDPPPPPATVAVAGEPLARWTDGPVLAGATVPVTAAPGSALRVDTVWSAASASTRPYTVFVHLLDADGRLVAQSDRLPLDGDWLTTCWRPGEAFADTFTIDLPAGLAAGDYTVRAGLYWLPTGERLPLEDGTADSVGLGSVRVAP